MPPQPQLNKILQGTAARTAGGNMAQCSPHHRAFDEAALALRDHGQTTGSQIYLASRPGSGS